MKNNLLRNRQFYYALLFILAIIVASIGNYQRWWDLHFYVGPLYLHHWLGWAGTAYIALFVPVYAILKRRYPDRYGTLVTTHVFSNLGAFLLISVHFTQHMGRPAAFAPILGTGLALYIITAIMVVTGLMQRFRLAGGLSRSWRFIHVSLSLSFYIVIIIHVLHNLGII